VGDEILVRTQARTLLARWAHQAQVSFEVDLVDYERWAGWSVVARGVATVTDGTPEDTGLPPSGPRSWGGEEHAVLVRLPWTSLSGRQLGRGWDAPATMPGRSASF
jgi:hypothetical protein